MPLCSWHRSVSAKAMGISRQEHVVQVGYVSRLTKEIGLVGRGEERRGEGVEDRTIMQLRHTALLNARTCRKVVNNDN